MSLAASLDELMGMIPVSGHARRDLLRRMRAPERHYHTDAHLALLWRRHRLFGRGLAFRQKPVELLVASAIAFHDAVLDPERSDNEAESASLWRRAATEAALLGRAEIAWVADTIEATARHLAPLPSYTLLDRARLWVLDLDLTPLGEPPDVFARDARRLRAEHAHLDDESWNRNRRAFLASFAHAPRVFRTPVIARAFEAQTRANILREMAACRSCGYGRSGKG